MNAELEKKIELYVENKQAIAKAVIFDYDINPFISSLILTGAGKTADIGKMKEARQILKEREGMLSSFRGSFELVVLTKMCCENNPEGYIDDVLEVHSKIVRKRIIDYYSYILGAMTIVDFGKKNEADKIIAKSDEILAAMKKVHPILADEQDVTFTILLAMTDKDVDTIISEMEECYTYFKKTLKIKAESDSIQSLCELIVLSGGDLIEKCDKAAAIFDAFKDHGMRYGSYYEFASLGALLNLDMDKDELVDTVIEVSESLKQNKGFSMFIIDARTRLMFAAMLVAQHYADAGNNAYEYAVNSSVISSSVAIIVAEEVAALICTMIIAAQNNRTT